VQAKGQAPQGHYSAPAMRGTRRGRFGLKLDRFSVDIVPNTQMHAQKPRSPMKLQQRLRWTLVAHGLLLSAAALLATAAAGADINTSASSSPKLVGDLVREALGTNIKPRKKLNLVVAGTTVSAVESLPVANPSGAPLNPQASRAYAKARAAALAAHAEKPLAPENMQANEAPVPWSYSGEGGPQNWGKLRPEFSLCALGKRQSPINIQEGATLLGPAEPVQFNYTPSNAVVVNNGRTIQVDVDGNNTIGVRGARYQLLEFHFHAPSEEQINFRRAAMVAHLVHRNEQGQLAVVAVLLETGDANPLIDKVWTYMPLDANDQVRMPADLLNMNELLPGDQRYYQFMGSLTTPPCTEGVLWMVMMSPVQISRAQYNLFTQLYPANARPVQAVNARPVRQAQ